MSPRQSVPSVKHFPIFLSIGGYKFGVPLVGKVVDLGEVMTDHIWVDVRDLYGQRSASPKKCHLLTDYFWLKCIAGGTYVDSAVQELYLLASLCPFVRGNGANRLLPGARLSQSAKGRESWNTTVGALEEALSAPLGKAELRAGPMTMQRFHQQTLDMLFPQIDPELRAEYDQVWRELFPAEIKQQIMQTPRADEQLQQNWEKLNQRYGRHCNHPRRREILDILSYESMAALRRCYAALWYDLLPELARIGLPLHSHQFLRFIHLEHFLDPADTTSSLMHGHVFALHPAMSLLMSTKAGPKLFGEFAKQTTPEAQQMQLHDLLRAIYVSLCVYTGVRADERDRSRKSLTGDSCDFARDRAQLLEEGELHKEEDRDRKIDGLDL